MGDLVAAGAEGAIAGAGENDGPDIFVVAGLIQSLDQFIAGRAAKRVHLLGAVDRDPGHAITNLVDQVFKLHKPFPPFVRAINRSS